MSDLLLHRKRNNLIFSAGFSFVNDLSDVRIYEALQKFMIVKHTKKKKWDDGPLLQMWWSVQAILGTSDCLSIETQTDIYIVFTFLFSIRTEYSLFWCISEPKYIGTLLYKETKQVHGMITLSHCVLYGELRINPDFL